MNNSAQQKYPLLNTFALLIQGNAITILFCFSGRKYPYGTSHCFSLFSVLTFFKFFVFKFVLRF